MDKNVIKSGDYAVVQRQGYTKLHKLKEKGSLTLGNFSVELDNAIGSKYFEIFQMKPKEGKKKVYTLEKATGIAGIEKVAESGTDNRNIKDDGASQILTKEEIERLRDDSKSSVEIVEKLAENSKTFSSKTEYSQEKYLKKKHKKYFDYIYLRKPTIRILSQMYYRQDPAKTLGIRHDDLSQILTASNIQSSGNYLLYDSGTSGLLTAAFLNAIGANTQGKLIHMHPGNECQKTAVLALMFPKEQLDRCVNVNLYSVLRHFYQNQKNKITITEKTIEENEKSFEESEITKDSSNGEMKVTTGQKRSTTEELDEETVSPLKKQKLNDTVKAKPGWQIENESACEILQGKVDAIVVASKEHPLSIVKELSQFLLPSRSLVVFNLMREPLQDLYLHLKSRADFINIKLSNNFLRQYQVLPDRTHPMVNMNFGGYILTAQKIQL